MNKKIRQLLYTIFLLNFTSSLKSQSLPISSINIFGNRTVSDSVIIAKTRIHEGDTITKNSFDRNSIITALQRIPGIHRATVEIICCSHTNNGLEVFIGIQENDTAVLRYNNPPSEPVALPHKIIDDYYAFEKAMDSSILRGNAFESYSKGYSLMDDKRARSFQYRFILYANENLSILQKVIWYSSDPEQRAVAAYVIAYHDDKKKVLPDLMHAVYDQNKSVRNNAARAISIFARYMQKNPSSNLQIPPEPFIEMIHSVVWTDRNKGCAVLEALSLERDENFFLLLKKTALPELIEMAKWSENGHAFRAFAILGRMAGMKEEEILYRVENNRKLYLQKIIDRIKNG